MTAQNVTMMRWCVTGKERAPDVGVSPIELLSPSKSVPNVLLHRSIKSCHAFNTRNTQVASAENNHRSQFLPYNFPGEFMKRRGY